jgi:SAM-dependent methyltransferase
MRLKGTCPVCESDLVVTFLRREGVPVHQNLVMEDRISALEITRGDLNFTVCEECGFVFNQSFQFSKLSYGEHYDNTQTCSPSFRQYLSNLVECLVFEKNVQNSQIVEVGCGKGLFLRKLVETEGSGNKGYGLDPSYVGPASDLEGRLKFEKRYYDQSCANIPADVVICRHVIEHVQDPLGLLHTIRQALAGSPHARVFFETPDLEWILRNQVFWDFFYEHCSLFTTESLTTLFEVSGFRVESVQHVFEGQYLWLEARISDEKPLVTKSPGSIPDLARQLAILEGKLRSEWETKLQRLADKGKVALWGAGAKGVTFANLVDPEGKWIDCVVDLNPQKQDHYLPGTGHPIVNYKELTARGIATAILMNPNYHDENLALLSEARLEVELIDA